MAILVVDDDSETTARMADALRQAGDDWEVRCAASAKEALAAARDPHVDCVLLDYRLPDVDGLSCLRELRQIRPDVPVVMVTGAGSEGVAVEAMKLGAADYVVKHGTYVQVVPGIVREVLGRRALARLGAEPALRAPVARELPTLDQAVLARFQSEGLIARSPAMLRLFALIERAAQSRATVLIEGESGSGKELCARAVHAHGPRAAAPFLAQNCAAVPESLLESELFGHVRGAFTGADRNHRGLFEQADGGTLFLDEIGEASPSVQAKLLRVLQEREVRPIGTTASQPVDVRLVAATNRDLRRDIADGRFRLDLLYRLRVFPIVVPPLRERPEDVAGLAEHFLAAIEREEGRKTGGFEPATLTVLARYAWPGNVRELQNEVHRLVLCAEPDETLAPDMLAPWILEEVPASAMTDTPLRDLIRQVEAAIIQSRLREHGYRRAATARSLGITREALWAKLRQLGIVPPGPRTQ
jgi:DNA-binding NtrC family response regulator